MSDFVLPAGIPTVLVHGRYLFPDGTPVAGSVWFEPPGLLTFPDSDLFIAGPLEAQLDESGSFRVTLPATDTLGMNPTDWAYTVKERLEGVRRNRTFLARIPAADPVIDLADIAPADPSHPNYVPVPGPVGAQGPQGAKGATGAQGPKGDPSTVPGPPGKDGKGAGTVTAVNGIEPDQTGAVTLPAAIPATDKGATNGVATLVDGKVPSAQLPIIVLSVNGKTGPAVTLTASDVGAIATSSKGVANGVASLDAAGKIPASQLRSVAEFNVMDYGAKGNGTTDDAPAFRAALAAAASNGGGTVRIPGGTFLMDSALSAWPAPCLYVRDNTTIQADAGSVIRRGLTMGSARLVQNFDGTESNPGYTGHSNIHVIGGTWDGNAPAKVGAGNMFAFAHASNITVEGIRVLDQPNNHAIELNSIDGAKVLNCRFEGSVPKVGSPATTEAIQIDGAFGLSSLEGGVPYDNTFSQSITVRGNYVDGSAKCGPWGALVGSHMSLANKAFRRIVVTDNTIVDSLVYGIHAYDWYEVVISNNVIYSSNPDTYRSGIRITSGVNKCDAVSITGNILVNAGGLGHGSIDVETLAGASAAGAVMIANNVISGYSGDGIKSAASDTQILSNMIRNPAASATKGINLVSALHANLALNRITGGKGAIAPTGTIVYGNDPVITVPSV